MLHISSGGATLTAKKKKSSGQGSSFEDNKEKRINAF